MSVTNIKTKQVISAAAPDPDQLRMVFEVSDLFYYYGTGSTPTGIQRVQQELALELLQDSSGAAKTTLVIYDRSLQKWRLAPSEWFKGLVAAARSFRPGSRAWEETYLTFSNQLTAFPLKQFESGEWLVNVGASWALPSYFIQVRQVRRKGVRIAIFLHDCIPARHPAYFDTPHTVEYTYWLAQVRETADLVICNSESTRRDYLEIVKPASDEKVHVCRLDASWTTEREISAEADVAVSDLLADLGILDDDFVLSVGTIEPRKNHLTLVHVWDMLRNTHPNNCPKLLCVGRIGWKSDAVISQAKALGLLNSKIFFVGGLPDDVLAALYKKCLFTVYLSYYEGWGLPITESLASGKVCVAGSNSSLLEAGSGYALHVDERSETNIHDAIAQLLDDPSGLADATAKVREEYSQPTWSSVADALQRTIAGTGAEETASLALPQLEMATFYKFARSAPLQRFDRPEAAEIFCMGHVWHQPESWGTWTNKEVAELGFRISSAHTNPTIFLGLASPPGGASATIHRNGKLAVNVPPFTGRRVVRIPLQEHPDEEPASGGPFIPVRLRIVSSRAQNMRDLEGSKDVRILAMGYAFIIGFDRNSIFERLEFMEKMLTNEL
jgi:glycosyltransferase involved in cell wall biosynthesis